MKTASFGAGLVGLAALLLAGAAAQAQSCRPGDIEVGRDQSHIYCKPRAEYAQCIGQAGQQMKDELSGSCGRAYKDCFEEANISISLQGAACLAGALAGCGAGQVACAQVCNVLFSAEEWQTYHECTVTVTPCYDAALAHDRSRKEACKH